MVKVRYGKVRLRSRSTEATPALDKSYTYDAAGNRSTSATGSTSTGYTTNNLNQLTQTTIGGNNTALTYDANGNMTSEGSKTFGYNDADELTSVVVPGQTKSTFEYDSDGRKRISTEYTWDAIANDWTQSDETRYVYDGMDLVQERAANGDVKASFVRDGNIGGVLSMTNADGTFDYHYDGNGNVVALTDSNQNIVAQYSYDAYGNVLSSSGSEADKNPFRFSSKYFDADTGLYDYGYRHYDSSLGRWINRDPSGVSGGLNLYGFVGNSPGNAFDGYGLDPGDWWDIRSYKTVPHELNPLNTKGSLRGSLDSVYEGGAALLHGDTARGAKAYSYGILGQTECSDKFTHYGTRIAIGTASAAVVAAAGIGSYEFFALGNQSLLEGNISSNGNVLKVISRPFKKGFRVDPAHHGKPWGHTHFWKW